MISLNSILNMKIHTLHYWRRWLGGISISLEIESKDKELFKAGKRRCY